ncbi:MAG: methyl-accepting chemotaxis protein, partial [Oscillospiraceae bacterium]|nr:methyl-accepting chemotaxis protein [Oscillospiraceae bacterium]
MLKNMKIRARMLVSYLIIVAFLLITGIISVVMINRVADSLQSFYDNQFQSVTNAMDIRRKCFVVRTNMLNAMLTDDLTETNENINTAKSELQDMYTLLSSLETTFLGEQSLLTTVKADLDSCTATLDSVADLSLRNLRDDAYEMTRSVFRPYVEDIGDVMKTVGDTAKANALKKVEEADQMSTMAVIVVVLFIAASVVVSVLMAAIMGNSVSKPVQEMNRAAQEMAKGNMNVEVTYESKDELGEMANDIRLMTGNVRRVIQDINYCLGELAAGNYTANSQDPDAYTGDYRAIRDCMRSLRDTMHETLVQINLAADQVNAGGDQVSNSAQALAQGATQQASAVQELSATIAEISSRSQSNAQ